MPGHYFKDFMSAWTISIPNTSDTKCGAFPHTYHFFNSLDTSWVSHSSNQFWQDLELGQTSQVKGSVPQDRSRHPITADTNCKSHVMTCTSDQAAMNDPLLMFDNLLEWLTQLRKARYFLLLPVDYKG